MDLIDELIKILDYDERHPQIRRYLHSLQNTDITEEQKDLIYNIVAMAYDMGRDEATFK